METSNVVLTFESVNEILWCGHSNETSSAVSFAWCYLFFSIIFTKLSLGFFSNLTFQLFWELQQIRKSCLIAMEGVSKVFMTKSYLWSPENLAQKGNQLKETQRLCCS